jgi:ribose 5-phosphate isomerase B
LADRIAIASDHAAVTLKAALVSWLREQGHEVTDLGPHGEESVDYPDYGYALARTIEERRADFGVALCGSGIGISIAVNRNPAARCALVNEPYSARLARRHNDANIIAMGARLIGEDMVKSCLHAFLETEFEGGRHQKRVAKLSHFAKEPA